MQRTEKEQLQEPVMERVQNKTKMTETVLCAGFNHLSFTVIIYFELLANNSHQAPNTFSSLIISLPIFWKNNLF